MSNLIKSGFIAFSKDNAKVINSNEHRVIRDVRIDASADAQEATTMEEALAEALIRDVGLDGGDDMLLTMDSDEFAAASEEGEQLLQQKSSDMLDAAKREAEEIVSSAHDEAEVLRAAAYDEAEQLRASAQEEGFQQGYDAGQEKALSEFQEKERMLEERKEEIENYLVEHEKQIMQTTEHKMVELLCAFIPRLTGVVIDDNKEVLLHLINNAMRDLEDSKHFVIKVSSADYEDIVARKDMIYGFQNPSVQIEIFEDAKLNEKQCLIDTDNGMVNVSLDTQMKNLINAMQLLVKE